MKMITNLTRRLLVPAVAIAFFAPISLVGCGDENKTTTETKQTTPTGTTTEKVTESTSQSGSNPPPTTGTSGEPAPK